MKKLIKIILLALFFVISIALIFLFPSNYIGIDMLMGVNFLILFLILTYHLMVQKLNLFISSYLVFNYLFFFVSPLIQLYGIGQTGGNFPNTMGFNYILVTLSIVSIITFNIIFFISYYFFKRKIFKRIFQKDTSYNDNIFLILIVFSVIIFAGFANMITDLVMKEQLRQEMSIVMSLIVKKILFSLPIVSTIYFITRIRKKTKVKYVIALLISIALLIIFKNPLIEKRNALGPIYLAIVYFSFPSIFRTNARTFVFLFLSMVIVFPSIAILTHNNTADSLSEILNSYSFNVNSLIDTFSELHYDAFSNVLAAFSYMMNEGATNGMQLIGGLLFFIPREIWVDKPLSGGKEIGSYLTSNYDMWFDNLSMPFIGESIMNFGYFGIIIYPIILAIIVIFFDRLFRSNDLLQKIVAVYFAFHIIFLLRGDFTNAYAYFMGTFVALYIIPKTINKITKIKSRHQ